MKRAHPPRPAVLGLLCLCWSAAPGSAEDPRYPEIRPGLWRFHRTVSDAAARDSKSVLDQEKCTDPVADMKALNEKLVAMGCKFSPMQQSRDVYRFSATCPVPGGERATSDSVLTYNSPESYDLVLDARGIPGTPSGGTHEELEARRVGDCP